MPISEVKGDILKSPEEYVIMHQCNTTTNVAKGLSKAIFDAYPEANVYRNHYKRNVGQVSCHLCGPNTKRKILNLYAHIAVGNRCSQRERELRPTWFEQCLNQISMDKSITKVAMPKLIGCGLAGGDPAVYRAIIERWSTNNPNIEIVLYEL